MDQNEEPDISRNYDVTLNSTDQVDERGNGHELRRW